MSRETLELLTKETLELLTNRKSITDFRGSAWVYAFWLLVKRLWISTVLNLADGSTNAALALVAQVVDAAVLCGKIFYISRIHICMHVHIRLSTQGWSCMRSPSTTGPPISPSPLAGVCVCVCARACVCVCVCSVPMQMAVCVCVCVA